MSWPMVKLGDVLSFIRGVTFKPEDQVEPHSDGSIVVMRTKNVQVSGLDERDLIAIPSVMIKRDELILRNGDILISSANSWELVGKVSYINQLGYRATAGGFISIVRANEKTADTRYLYHWLSSPTSQHLIRHCGRQTTNISNLDVGRFKELEIPLPPLTEQKRIAAILDKADAIRRKRQQAIQLADDFLRAVFLEMFGDPVTNPKGWEVKSMQKLIKIQGGYAFKSEDFSESGIPVVKIGNANKVGFTTKGISFIQPDNPNKLTQYELYAGDLLMSLTGTVGKDDYANVTEVTDEYDMYYLNQRVGKISVINGQITKNFIKHYLANPKIKSEITKNNRGVRQANIGNADIYELSVPVPSKSMLEKFDMLVEQASLLMTKIDSAPAQIDSFFNALSQKAFSGTL